MTFSKTLDTLKQAGQDHEYYPTTNEIIDRLLLSLDEVICHWHHSTRPSEMKILRTAINVAFEDHAERMKEAIDDSVNQECHKALSAAGCKW